MKKETIEEAAQKYVEVGIYLNEAEKQQTEIAFYEGAKWQAKRMYSEEEVREILWEYIKPQSTSEGILLDGFLEQFKKK